MTEKGRGVFTPQIVEADPGLFEDKSRYMFTDPEFGDVYFQTRITVPQVRRVVYFGNIDPEIYRNCSDGTRFAFLQKFYNWEANGKWIGLLTNKEGDIGGITWFGERSLRKELEDYNAPPPEGLDVDYFGATFATRMYIQLRGKGRAQELYRMAHQLFMESDEYNALKNKGIWLGTKNELAARTYRKFGYVDIGKAKGETFMVLPSSLEPSQS